MREERSQEREERLDERRRRIEKREIRRRGGREEKRENLRN